MDKDIMSEAFENRFRFSEDELKQIYKGYGSFNRYPTPDELDICGQILECRRKKTDGYSFSSVTAEDTSVIETINDLREKAIALRGKEAFPMAFGDAVAILGDYMEMIGRVDESLTFAMSGEAPDISVTDGEGRAVFAFKEPKLYERRDIASGFSPQNTAILYLDEAEVTEEGKGILNLFANEGFRNLNKTVIQIDEYGILGALYRICGAQGSEADLTRLPCGEGGINPVKDLHGKYIMMIDRGSIGFLTFLGNIYGVKHVYFAYPVANGRISVYTGVSMSFPVDTLNDLLSGRKEIAPTVTAERRSCGGGSAISQAGGRLTASATIAAEEGFLGTVDRISSLILNLVSRGVDRRAVCLAFEYISGYETLLPEVDLGDALGLCLGAYRVGMELATPVGEASVIYAENGSSLFCTAYAVKPRIYTADSAESAEGEVYFMPVAKGNDGLIDFSDLRRVCDRFAALYKKGRVIRASAVTAGGFKAALDELIGDNKLTFKASGESLIGTQSLGLIFVCKGSAEGVSVGTLSENKDFS